MEWLDMEIDNENRDIRFEARASEGNLQVSVQWGSMDQQDDFVAYCNWWIWTPSWFIIVEGITTYSLPLVYYTHE